MRFGHHRFSRCRNAHLSSFNMAFNAQLDARLIAGVRNIQTSLLMGGSEYRAQGFVMGQTAQSQLSTILSEALASSDDEVLETISLEDALESLIGQKSWRMLSCMIRLEDGHYITAAQDQAVAYQAL